MKTSKMKTVNMLVHDISQKVKGFLCHRIIRDPCAAIGTTCESTGATCTFDVTSICSYPEIAITSTLRTWLFGLGFFNVCYKWVIWRTRGAF